MASIRSYRTSRGERRYEVRFRDGQGRERSKAFSARKDAQSFKLDVERKRQAGILYQASPERFGAVAAAWLERYDRGAAGTVRPRPRSIALARENLAVLASLNELPLDRIRRPVVEDLIVAIAERGPRRAEMALALLKRILRAAEERGQVVDPAIYRIKIAKHAEREPRFLTWDEAEELRAWLPERICRIVPVAILTMLRRGEILGLRDRDVDFETGAISVFAQSQDGVRVSPKTRAGRRTVDVGPAVLRLLREQQLARAPNDQGLFFPNEAGDPFDAHNFISRLFKPAAAAAGIPSSPSTTSATPAPR